MVDDVYVYGIASTQLAPGEKEVVAAVVPKDAAIFNAQQLFDVCREHLEAGMVPGFIQVLAQIPKTASTYSRFQAAISMVPTSSSSASFFSAPRRTPVRTARLPLLAV